MIRRALTLVLVVAIAATAAVQAFAAPRARTPEPILAYYYIWFDQGSWRRAKTDYPLLGRYSSDDVAVMRQHVRWAKQAGISGFIVSWKSTPTLNSRLEKLIKVADEERFKLAIIYQGLNFEREPLPVQRIAHDLDVFAERFASDDAFAVFGKPLVVWSGTWRFSSVDVARVTGPRRRSLLILATERNLQGYARLAKAVDGDAYYWSSVNPDTFPGYEEKLADLGRAVRAYGGLWIAPAAPGFDARLIGGTTVVPRRDGATLRRELDAAVQSSPDAVGLISWNEFSENSFVEPSLKTGRRYLEVLADVGGSHVSAGGGDFDSSESGSGIGYGLPILSGLLGVVFAALLVAFVRRHIRTTQPAATTTGGIK